MSCKSPTVLSPATGQPTNLSTSQDRKLRNRCIGARVISLESVTAGFPDLVTQERAELRKLATLLEIGQTLAATDHLKSALGRVLEALGHHHGMMHSFVMLLDADVDKMRSEASYGLNGDVVRRVSYRVGEGIVGRVVQKREADCCTANQS